MKLYATVTSDRASKGQGGNEAITITLKAELLNKERPIIARVYLYNDVQANEYLLTVVPLGMIEDSGEETTRRWRIAKGEKQKGDTTCKDCYQIDPKGLTDCARHKK